MKINNFNNFENTETLPKDNKYIDKMSTEKATITMIMNSEKVIRGLMNANKYINTAIDKIYKILKSSNSGRIIYAGSGTSGRIGVLDAVELLPTFGWPANRIEFAIAGGINSLTRSAEGAEDIFDDGFNEIIDKNCNKNDVLLSLSASGQSQFTLGTLKAAKKTKTFSVGISNNTNSLLANSCDLFIPILTGAEILAGSTRLNAGTSQKVCLNIISTLVMAKLGNVQNGLMVNMIPSNKKLKKRKKLIKEHLKNMC
jgi:N-acetylmuramic acid 6-phosphate etherase